MISLAKGDMAKDEELVADHVSSFRVDFADDVDKSHDRSGSNPPPPPLGRPGGGPGAQPGWEFQKKENKRQQSIQGGEGTAKKRLGQMQPACFKALVLFIFSPAPLPYTSVTYTARCV